MSDRDVMPSEIWMDDPDTGGLVMVQASDLVPVVSDPPGEKRAANKSAANKNPSVKNPSVKNPSVTVAGAEASIPLGVWGGVIRDDDIDRVGPKASDFRRPGSGMDVRRTVIDPTAAPAIPSIRAGARHFYDIEQRTAAIDVTFTVDDAGAEIVKWKYAKSVDGVMKRYAAWTYQRIMERRLRAAPNGVGTDKEGDPNADDDAITDHGVVNDHGVMIDPATIPLAGRFKKNMHSEKNTHSGRLKNGGVYKKDDVNDHGGDDHGGDDHGGDDHGGDDHGGDDD